MATRAMSRGAPWLTRDEWKALVGVVLVAAAVMLVVTGLLWVLGAEHRAIASMEPGRRALLFQETLEGFETLCQEDPGGALTADCRRQAHFLRQFPECEGACREVLSPYLGRGTR
jgi:hypothetical protein